MIINVPRVETVHPCRYHELLKLIEAAGRTCYKSEDKITEGSAENFIRNIIKRGHESVLEHGTISLRFICDRGVTHEVVRHRIAAYSQESTRYCNYSQDKFGNQIHVMQPSFMLQDCPDNDKIAAWTRAMENAEKSYFELLNLGCTPQEARSVLPNSLATDIVITYNIREWRHFFKMRCSKAAHPDMRIVAGAALKLLKEDYPLFFEDIEVEE